MNILIVGNGFDLSHYLPTKYDHFMDVMDAIESNSNELMKFDELFAKCREDWFIAKTKKYYKTENITIEKQQLIEIRNLLKENCWYQYFKSHVQEIKTWIDFEVKISEALKCICKFLNKIDEVFERFGDCNLEVYFLDKGTKREGHNFYMTELDSEQLILLKLINRNNNYGKMQDFWHDTKLADIEKKWFLSSSKTSYGFSKEKYLSFLVDDLENFTNILNFYLANIVNRMETINTLKIKSDSWFHPKKIYSFNYTNTFKKNYSEVSIEYLHGACGELKNLVLGISELEDDNLRKLKAYGFTKYHQKLFKNTDYLFLDDYLATIDSNKKEIRRLEQQVLAPMGGPYTRASQQKLNLKESSQSLNLNFMIWGHSLDVSDEGYIKDLFSLNDEIDRNVRVTVYYFDKPAKFSFLNNLLAILGKDKVEQWMKSKWLKFEPNPEIDFGI